ncbi:hypothetical protein, partial [Alteriqipengyuania sp.]
MSRSFLPFDGSKYRCVRADIHIDELKSILSRYTENMPFNLYFETSNVRNLRAFFGVVGYPPAIASFALGDVIHSLRSSLDHLAGDLARLNRRSPRSVGFPISDSASSLKSAIENRNFRRVSKDCLEKLNEISPYKGGNDALYYLNKISNFDKHSISIPIWPQFECKELIVAPPVGSETIFYNFKADPDARLNVNYLPYSMKFINASTKMVFHQDVEADLKGLEVIGMVEDIRDTVRDVISQFEKVTTGRNRPFPKKFVENT